ncbi:hypothetical protein C0989_010641 [Termitomyces sp. Mn162]|nr:hypothetical protein C0989_010641 [Termitomyces sp. Mn162]
MVSANSTIPPPKNNPLDSLHSPDVTYFAAEDREVETIASATDSEFNDIALDDEALFSAHPGYEELSSHDLDSPDTARPPIVSTTPQEADPQPTKTGHKKSASTTTIRSDNNLPFIISRLQDEHRLSQRGSVDGQHKLQEEFARLHKEEEKATEPATNKTIDWGASCDINLCQSMYIEMGTASDFWGAVISGN